MTDNYLLYAAKAKIPALTTTQMKFAVWLIENRKMLQVIGNLEIVFNDVRLWLKTNPELWGEVLLPDEASEENFDWELNYRQIDNKYSSI